ncbi:MAG: acyltransferase [Prevotellaceae bacterium]|jgi:peptidoglycan/LPS O-acetylase OafA/YrhL|nr:acyltransferase [Prevotellaceae bacterium]
MQHSPLSSKPHFEVLDGLRGVAAIMVLLFHIFETYNIVNKAPLLVGHGYLAVDFFFALSGFVIGYAYDDRWGRLSVRDFLKRRVIRLHPMVVAGMLLGAALFYFGASPEYALIAGTPVWKMALYLLLGLLLIPTPPSADIRGWQETYTLDAPCWSLFFEYIANILYALFIRRFSKVALAVLVALAAGAVLLVTIAHGSVIGGWVLSAKHMGIGFTRLIFPFFAGLLLYRIGKLPRVRKGFLWCSLILVAVLATPSIGGLEHTYKNGLFEAFAILIVFPAIVYLGAGSKVKSARAASLCKLLGDISYPVYLVNYPIIYIFTGWISKTKYSLAESWEMATLVFVATIALSYALLRWYDIPVRRWLAKRN